MNSFKYALAVVLCSTAALAQVAAIDTQAIAHDDSGHDHAGHECNVVATPDDVELELYMESIGATTVDAMPRYLIDIPITIHVIRRSNGTGGPSQASIDAANATMNVRYQPVGIRFVQQGATRFINNDDMYSNTDTQAEINAIANTDLVPNTVNVYFCTDLRVEDGPDDGPLPDALCGQASFTSSSGYQAVLVDVSCLSNGSTYGHEMGHFFNLYHTHETAFGNECPDGSNCSDAGDRLCDTPADPDLTNRVNESTCMYTGNVTRCGQLFNPDPTNMMSYSEKVCRDYFSPGQASKALATLFNQRGNLLSGQQAVTWVDFYDNNGSGTYADPFNNFTQAVNSTANGGRIVFKPSSTPGAYTLNRPMTFDSFRGTATIGR